MLTAQTMGRWPNKSLRSLSLVCKHWFSQRNRGNISDRKENESTSFKGGRSWGRIWSILRSWCKWRGLYGVPWSSSDPISRTESTFYYSSHCLCQTHQLLSTRMGKSKWSLWIAVCIFDHFLFVIPFVLAHILIIDKFQNICRKSYKILNTCIRSNLIVIHDGFKSKMLPNNSDALFR